MRVLKIQIITSKIYPNTICMENIILVQYSLNWQPCYHLTFYYEKHTLEQQQSSRAAYLTRPHWGHWLAQPTRPAGRCPGNATIYHLDVVILRPGIEIWTYLVQLMDILGTFLWPANLIQKTVPITFWFIFRPGQRARRVQVFMIISWRGRSGGK